MEKKYVIALDQGTTSSRCIIFDKAHQIVATAQKEFPQIYPHPGWVEHNPMDIYVTQFGVLMEAITKAEIHPSEIAGIGITNQRETTVVWEKATGKPIHNAIVWQCRRTADLCEKLKLEAGMEAYIRENTGLLIDAYFSGTKIQWLLENVEGAREKAERGELLFGTIDTWLIWKLTEGRTYVTDYTNASRTMLYNIKELKWDTKILSALGIPESMLPEVHNSSEVYGYTNIQGVDVPICGIAGDQQAALFGQVCVNPGDVKNTYGTGNFILMNTGEKMVQSQHGLLTTIAYGLDGKITYALEGSVFVGGALIQWLRDEMRFFKDAADVNYFASKVEDSGGVYVVPAFTGLGAPHWDMYARGTIFGLTRGSSRNHIIRASLDAIAFQSKDVMDAMVADTAIDIREVKVDGGASVSDQIMQFQSDIMCTRLVRPVIRETTALGAAYLAGLAVGFFENIDQIKESWVLDKAYTPAMEDEKRERVLRGWRRAVQCTKMFHGDLEE
ncbi:MAG: glycerol kinase GlpK [Cellulosilyticaceae bacterium]